MKLRGILRNKYGDSMSLCLVECGWNKSWVPDVLPSCAAKACPDIPFPPKKLGLVYSPDERNNMTLVSGILNLYMNTKN